MRMLIVRTLGVVEFDIAAGIHKPGPGGGGGQIATWGMEPGRFPELLYPAPWGKPVRGALEWSPARPVLWDVDVRQSEGLLAFAVLATGFHLSRQREPWRYFEAPGGEPLFLAGLGSMKGFSVVARQDGAGGFPVVVPGELAAEWVIGKQPREGLLAMPLLGPELFRSWPVADPLELEDGPERLVPLLD
ncbi:MAG: hypothetical protein J0L89_08105 [Xanthomonadales bacterium]|nr:hypothetical protein [Xanthomonadales bacterium]MBN8261159.1 hypothetical protein [Xanthomonadales bacterium]